MTKKKLKRTRQKYKHFGISEKVCFSTIPGLNFLVIQPKFLWWSVTFALFPPTAISKMCDLNYDDMSFVFTGLTEICRILQIVNYQYFYFTVNHYFFLSNCNIVIIHPSFSGDGSKITAILHGEMNLMGIPTSIKDTFLPKVITGLLIVKIKNFREFSTSSMICPRLPQRT